MSKSRSILGFAVPLQYFAKAQQLHSSRQGTSHILRKKIWGEGYKYYIYDDERERGQKLNLLTFYPVFTVYDYLN